MIKRIIGGKGIQVQETPYEIVISDYAPNAKRHFWVSMVKSVVRMTGYCWLFGMGNNFATGAAIILLSSEVIGIIEELV
jgi:hypothetical protein